MKKLKVSDLLFSIIIPLIVLTTAVGVVKGLNSSLWEKEEYTRVINNASSKQAEKIIKYDGEFIVKLPNNNDTMFLVEKGKYFGFVNAFKYDLNYQILLSVLIFSLVYFFLLTAYFNTTLWILIAYVGYGVYLWLSDSYLAIDNFDIISMSCIALLLMIIWTAIGIYRHRNITDETETGLIGAWNVLYDDCNKKEEWFVQDSEKLLISKDNVITEHHWQKLTGKDAISITDMNGQTLCLDYKRETEKEELINKDLFRGEDKEETIFNIEGKILVKQPSKIESLSCLNDKIKDINHINAVAERLYKRHKKKHRIYTTMFITIGLILQFSPIILVYLIDYIIFEYLPLYVTIFVIIAIGSIGIYLIYGYDKPFSTTRITKKILKLKQNHQTSKKQAKTPPPYQPKKF